MTSFREHVQRQGRSALLVGATGATGSKILQELINRGDWSRVVVISRRDPGVQSEKVETIIVKDMKNDAIDVDKIRGLDHLFVATGTTRDAAGSADAFRDIEVGIPENIAKASKEAGISHASVVSAGGANPDISFAPKWFHPLWYTKCLGLKERAITQQGFSRVSIFRPGLLAREGSDRAAEKALAYIMSSLDVGLLAKAMVNDAETTPPPSTPEEPSIFTGNSLIKKLAASFTPSP